MFTSRAEYRLLLREDNADLRLTEKGRQLGLVDDGRWAAFCIKREAIEREQQRLRDIWLRPGRSNADRAEALLGGPLTREIRAAEALNRPEVSYAGLMSLEGVGPGVADPRVAEQIEIQAKYAGYIERQRDEIERQRQYDDTPLPEALDYAAVGGLSNEVRQKLSERRPATIGHAGRIPGVTPAALSLLLVHLKKCGHRLSRSA